MGGLRWEEIGTVTGVVYGNRVQLVVSNFCSINSVFYIY